MSITSIGGSSSLHAASEITSFTASRLESASGSGGADGCSAEISGPAKWMKELESLLSTDPDRFKQVTSSIAEQLRQAASGASGSEAQALSGLADQFDQASSNGDLSALMPAGGPPPPPPPDGADPASGVFQGVQKYAEQAASTSSDGMEAVLARIDQLIASLLQGQGAGGTSSGSAAFRSDADRIIESALRGVSA